MHTSPTTRPKGKSVEAIGLSSTQVTRTWSNTWFIDDCVAASYLVMHALLARAAKEQGHHRRAVYGNFFAPKQQGSWCVVARGPRQSALELIRPDDHGKVQTVQDGARDGAIGMAS